MIRRGFLLVALAACGRASMSTAIDVAMSDAGGELADAGAARSIGRTHDAHVFDVADSGDELAAADVDAPSDDGCAETVFTHLLCYGTPSGPGRSATPATCADAGAGCRLNIDPAGANPTVWCCP